MVFGICKGKTNENQWFSSSFSYFCACLFGSKFVFLNLFLAVSLFSSFFSRNFRTYLFFKLLFLGFVHLIDFLDLKGLESTSSMTWTNLEPERLQIYAHAYTHMCIYIRRHACSHHVMRQCYPPALVHYSLSHQPTNHCVQEASWRGGVKVFGPMELAKKQQCHTTV